MSQHSNLKKIQAKFSTIIQLSDKKKEMNVDQLIESFEQEITRWNEFNAGLSTFETGDGGPRKKCRRDIGVKKATYNAATKQIRETAEKGDYSGPSKTPLTEPHFGKSGTDDQVWDIVLIGGTDKINYHIHIIPDGEKTEKII